ncbi:1,3-beta-glucan synthase component-domain-containing protein, partial [Ochromonadaceae sp. CCMP2298]
DVERLVLVLASWAESNDLFSRFTADALPKLVAHITSIVSALKAALPKRQKAPVVTPDFLIQQQSQALHRKSEYTSEMGGGRVKKSVSTGFLSALNESNDEQTGQTASQIARQFQKLQPFRKDQVLLDNLRDRVREDVRNLLTILRSALKVNTLISAEGQDLVDRIVFILSLESGFIWNDVYASAQLDDLATDPRVSRALAKASGLLTMRVTQAEVRSHEARRRLNFFMNSLYMDMPQVKQMRFSKEYTCITPYYSEDILLAKDTLESRNSDGVSTLLYLQTLYKDDWNNFL